MRRYTVYVTPEAFREIKELPCNTKQRVRQAIRDLAENPHPFTLLEQNPFEEITYY